MSHTILQGQLVSLQPYDVQKLVDAEVRWSSDSLYWRLLDSTPHPPATISMITEELRSRGSRQNQFYFAIHSLEGDRPIGFIELDVLHLSNRNAWVGIGIGERDFWGKGYGTDAMRVLLRYAFLELNLHRVTLGTFEYNERAIHSYEKAGFVVEGRSRHSIFREGQPWDEIFMGVLRKDWERLEKVDPRNCVSE